MAKDKREQVLDEMDKCVKLLVVWVILKGNEIVGRITSRPSSTRSTSYVTVQLYSWATEKNAEPLYGYERMTGWGYNRTETGIGYILAENREKLKNDYGIELAPQDWDIQNTWQKDIEAAGYKVIQAI